MKSRIQNIEALMEISLREGNDELYPLWIARQDIRDLIKEVQRLNKVIDDVQEIADRPYGPFHKSAVSNIIFDAKNPGRPIGRME